MKSLSFLIILLLSLAACDAISLQVESQSFSKRDEEKFDGKYRYGCFNNKCWSDCDSDNAWCYTSNLYRQGPTAACERADDCVSTWSCSSACAGRSDVKQIEWKGDSASGCFFYGNDLRLEVSKTASDCSQLCSLAAECTHFTWSEFNGGSCWLKSGLRSKQDAIQTYQDLHCGLSSKTKDLNYCSSSPCLNGATCKSINNGNNFKCLCSTDFSGETCEIPIMNEIDQNKCSIYKPGQIWEYSVGGYFIQISECQWMYYYKKTYWLNEFVSLSVDSVKGEVLTLVTNNWEYEISAESAILYERNGTDRKYSQESKGGWKTPTQTCSNFHKKDYFETLDGYVYKELPDCHWIILKDDSFWNTCDFVQVKDDPTKGRILFLTNANNDVEIYEKNLVWNPLLDKSERHSYPGEWKSSGTELPKPAVTEKTTNDAKVGINSCSPYRTNQIWEYDSGSYFIQATDCLWLNIKNNKQSGILSFVSINEDPTEGQYIEITGTKTTYKIFEKSAIKSSKNSHSINEYLTGQWTSPDLSQINCINLKNNNVWKSNEGDYFKQLADCNWILVKKNKIHRWFDSVQTKTDSVDGQYITLNGGIINYKIFDNKVVIVDLANPQSAPNVWHGGWISA